MNEERVDLEIDDSPQPLIYQGQSASAATGGGFFDISSSPRLVWYASYWLLWLGPPVMSCGLFVLSFGTENMILTIPLGLLSWGWLLIGWRVSRFLADVVTSIFISTLCCPGCGEHHQAVSRWSCGCGYTDHRERHVMMFRCPKCGGTLGS